MISAAVIILAVLMPLLPIAADPAASPNAAVEYSAHFGARSRASHAV